MNEKLKKSIEMIVEQAKGSLIILKELEALIIEISYNLYKLGYNTALEHSKNLIKELENKTNL